MLGERGPVAVALGNHDERTNAIAALVGTAGEKEPVPNKWVSAIDTGLLRMLALDSLYETNVTPGFLGGRSASGSIRISARMPTAP